MTRVKLMQSLVVGMFAILLSGGLPPASANETSGIGGGPNFVNGSEFPFISGLDSTVTASFFVENLGSGPIQLGVSHGAPRGVIIEPSEGQKTLFERGDGGNFEFDIRVTEPVVPGSYRTTINLSEIDPDLPEEGGSFYVPALSADIVIEVFGASASARLTTVSALTGEPAVGDLALFYIGSNGTEVQIYEANAARLETLLVPGNYVFTFTVPGLQRQEFEFSIKEDEELDLVFEIPTIEFLGVGAATTRNDRGFIQSVALNMDVFNNLEPIEEQIFFQANISRNGELIEEFVIAALPNLPREGSIFRANYIRENGFEQGDWEFEFEIVGDSFSLISDEVVSINSPGIFQSYLQEIVIAFGALVIVGLLIPKSWWNRLLRRSASETKPKRSPTKFPENSLPSGAGQTSPSPASKLEPIGIATTEKPHVFSAPKLIESESAPVSEVSAINEPQTSSMTSANENQKVKSGLFNTSKTKKHDQKQKLKKTRTLRAPTSDPSTQGELARVIDIRKRLLEMEDQGTRTLALNYKIDSIFVDEGEVVIERATGKPYSDRQISLVKEFRSLESQLDNIETPVLRAEAIKILVREKLVTNRR